MNDNNDNRENDTNHNELPGPWAKTYIAKSKNEMLNAYSEWATTYDVNSIVDFGYIAPKRSAKVLSNYLQHLGWPKDSLIADIGAGTGLVGQELHELGYTNIIALDYSREMLQIAKTKECYKSLYCVDLCDSPKSIEMDTGFKIMGSSFDAIISVGTFTPNHVGIDGLLNTIAFLRPGGVMLLSLRDDFILNESNGFRAKLEELESLGVLLREFVTDSELYTYKVSQSIFFRCWVFRVL